MNKNWIRIIGLFLATAALTGVLAVVQILMADNSPDPTLETVPLENELYNGYGLEGDIPLSQTLVFDRDGVVCYEDRLFKHVTYQEEQPGTVANVSRWLLEENAIENVYILPVPGRILVEEGYKDAQLPVYEEFLAALEKELPESAQILNVLPALEAHSDSYIYFRTEDAWTHRGAYYGSVSICQALGIEAFALEEYWEYYSNDASGSLRASYAPDEVADQMPDDHLFHYLHSDSKNAARVRMKDQDWVSQPAIIPSAKLLSAFLNNSTKMHSAVLWGSQKATEKADETLLVLCDGVGKLAATYLADYYKSVYVINIVANDSFISDLPQLLAEYNIKDVVWIQSADKMGNKSYSLALLDFVDR